MDPAMPEQQPPANPVAQLASVLDTHAEQLNLQQVAQSGNAKSEQWLKKQWEDLLAPIARIQSHGTTPVSNTDQYSTQLTPDEEARFTQWRNVWAPHDSGDDYDLRGAFKEGLLPDATTGHWSDKYKKPNHETFSVESMYAQYGFPGHWSGKDGDIYVPGKIPQPSMPSRGR